MLKFLFVCVSVVSYVAFVLLLFVPHLCFSWCLRRDVHFIYFDLGKAAIYEYLQIFEFLSVQYKLNRWQDKIIQNGDPLEIQNKTKYTLEIENAHGQEIENAHVQAIRFGYTGYN